MFKIIIFTIFTIFFLTGCFEEKKENSWTAFIYPDKNDLKKNIKSPVTFPSLDECEKISLFEIKNQKLEDIATFKCGLNCTYKKEMKLEVCEQMISPIQK